MHSISSITRLQRDIVPGDCTAMYGKSTTFPYSLIITVTPGMSCLSPYRKRFGSPSTARERRIILQVDPTRRKTSARHLTPVYLALSTSIGLKPCK